MTKKQTKTNSAPSGLVGAEDLLEILCPYEKTRMSLRFLRELQAKRLIPFLKIGRRVMFDPVAVRRALDAQFTVHPVGK